MNLKKIIGKAFTSEFVGTGPSSYKKRIYQAAVSQRLRNTGLEVSTQAHVPATGHLDQDFPWFPSVLEQMLSWYPKRTSFCMLLSQTQVSS